MRRIAFVAIGALALHWAVTAIQREGLAHAQQTGPETPTFRASVETVVVDVVVTDREGRSVTGLTVDDFEIFENGRPQAITTFTSLDVPVERSERIWADAEPDVQTNTNPPGRVYLFLLDGSVAAEMALRARHWLRLFFEDYFGDNDLAAIVVGRGLATDGQDFIGNRRLLLAAVDKFSGVASDPRRIRDLQERIELLARMSITRRIPIRIR